MPATIIGWDLFSDVARRPGRRRRPRACPGAARGLGRPSSSGRPVAAIGSPFGEQSSLSVGVVSAIDRTIDSLTSGYSVADAIQTDAPINRGNSGGPLFDARGRVIGINAQIRSTSGNAEGVGFAIPIDTAKRALDQLLRDGQGRLRLRRGHDPGRHARAGEEVRPRLAPRRADREGRARHAGLPRRAARRHAHGRLQRPSRSRSAAT